MGDPKSESILECLKPVVYFLGAALGNNCEVVLHDLSQPERSVIAIANGHITGRQVGSPVTDLVLRLLRRGGMKQDALLNYETRTRDGRKLRSSTLFIRDNESRIIGAMCINWDLTGFLAAKSVIDALCHVTKIDSYGEALSERFEVDIMQVLNDLVRDAIDRAGKPVPHMTKDDKIQVVKHLDEKGAFLIKGALDQIAAMLGVSRYTVYNYLEELRAEGGSIRVP